MASRVITTVIQDAISHINNHITDIKIALEEERRKISKASHRAEILDHMKIKATLARDKMVDEFDALLKAQGPEGE